MLLSLLLLERRSLPLQERLASRSRRSRDAAALLAIPPVDQKISVHCKPSGNERLLSGRSQAPIRTQGKRRAAETPEAVADFLPVHQAAGRRIARTRVVFASRDSAPQPAVFASIRPSSTQTGAWASRRTNGVRFAAEKLRAVAGCCPARKTGDRQIASVASVSASQGSASESVAHAMSLREPWRLSWHQFPPGTRVSRRPSSA